ncbi:hypothetical protein D3C77_565920 [compost metagenome]
MVTSKSLIATHPRQYTCNWPLKRSGCDRRCVMAIGSGATPFAQLLKRTDLSLDQKLVRLESF